MTPEFITLDSVRLEVRRIAGTKPGPTLVFLHEGLGSVGLWRDFPDKVARPPGLPALLYSRRGYGRSDSARRQLTPDFMHREALDVLPKLLAAARHRAAAARRPLRRRLDRADPCEPPSVAGVVALAPHVFVED